ncbi:ABC transporter ATP-binding protein, partial [Leuconostoc mesenteroides]
MTELKANHLDIKFDDEIILEDISLEIRPEQFILLVGSSGCGKSTLMTALAGLYPKYGGELSQEVSLNHQSIAQIKANHRAKKVAMLFQHPDQQFAMDRVEDELIFSLENLSLTTEEIDKRINSALSEVGIESLRHRELSYLSGGELQKVALAETLAMGAEIILLDEPFAAVDPEHRHELQVLLKKLVDQGHGILVSDHDTSGYENLITDLYRIENRHIACIDSTA